MYDLLILIVIIYVLYFRKIESLILIGIIVGKLGYDKIKEYLEEKINNKKNETSIFKKDLSELNKSNSNNKINKALIIIATIATSSIYIVNEYIASHYFLISSKVLFIFAVIHPLILTHFLWDSFIIYYSNSVNISELEKSFDNLFYEKIKKTKIENTDNYNQSMIINYLEKQRNLMLEYKNNQNMLKLYSILVIVDLGIVYFFGGIKLTIIIFVSYLLFYNVLYKRYKNDLDERNTNLDKIIENKNVYSSYIFSDFRNMISYNNKNIENNYKKIITKNNTELNNQRNQINKISTMFFFKFSIFKRIVYFFTVIYFFNLNVTGISLTANITKSLVVLSYLFMANDHVFLTLTHYNKMKSSEEEYNHSQIQNIKNTRYLNFLKTKSKNVKMIKNELFIYDIKLKKKIIYLKGESGKGKTTILKSIAYFRKNLEIAYLSQELDLNINKIKLKDIIQGFLKEYNEEYINLAIKLSRLDSKFNIDSIVNDVSGGEKQRIKIARIIYFIKVNKSNILIMDEPDNNLDIINFKEIVNNLLKINELKQIIFTSHKPEVLKYLKNYQIIEIN